MKSGRCVKCGETPVILVKTIPDLNAGSEAEMTVFRRHHFFSSDAFGRLRLYVCQACEYAEWSVDGARDLPVGDMENAELVWADDAPEKAALEALEKLRKT